MKVWAILLVALLVQQLGGAAPKKVKIVDRDVVESGSIEAIGRIVCAASTTSGADKNWPQISRVSTLKSLKEFFDKLPENHALNECKRLHGDALNELYELTSASNENVCSDQKVGLIEDYHDKYISTHDNHKQIRLDNNSSEAPQVLRLFFMHYAMEVNAICKIHLINNLEWDLKEQFGQVEEFKQLAGGKDGPTNDDASMFGKALRKFSEMYHVRDFDDVVLFWALIDGSIITHQDYQPVAEVDKRTGQQVRLLAKVGSVKPMRQVQRSCLNKFKPIYAKLILPIIRLADLGYSNSRGEQFKVELEELRNNEMVKHWYSITQLCEAVIPMKFYEDRNLDQNELILITKEEADFLEASQLAEVAVGSQKDDDDEDDEKPLEYEPSTNSMEHVDSIESVHMDQVQALVGQVNTNLLAKNRSMRRAMVHMFRHVKKQIKSTLASVKVSFSSSSSSSSGSNKQLATPMLATTLDQVSEADLALMECGPGEGRLLSRKAIKRQKGRQRKGDVDMLREMRSQQLSYKRTKTWSEIINGWMNIVSEIAPTRIQMILVGGLLALILFAAICLLPLMVA